MSATSMLTNTPHATPILAEADRLMTVCNSCRYCEGLCAVFPAMEMRRTFADADLDYLANLCHGCGACFDDCQFSPPHEFNVNVPRALAEVRNDSYRSYAWPGALRGSFARNGLAVGLICAVSVTLFVLGCVALREPSILWASNIGAGAFYRVIPHNTLVLLFGCAFLYAVIAIVMGAVRFWKDTGAPGIQAADLGQALKNAASLRYLDGGKGGCGDEKQPTSDPRRLYHHLTSYGFLLCFLSTSVATLYHYALGKEAPYFWYDIPVLLGLAGGIGLLIGPAGLLWTRIRRPRVLRDERSGGMDLGFIVMLFLTSLSGLGLLALRETALMGLLLAVHLGVVFALFITLPYGKFVHGIYRLLALVRYARDSRTYVPAGED